MAARSASATGLRPTSSSGASGFLGRRRPGASDRRSAAAARRAAGWPLRSVAFGVGPLPARPRARLPPEPTVAPFLLLRTAPLREELPAIISLFFLEVQIVLVQDNFI